MTDLIARLKDTLALLQDQTDQAQQTHYDHLSELGNREEQDRKVTEARERAARALTEIHAKAVSEEAAASAGAKNLLESNEPTRDEWERVKMVLDAGKPIDEILAESDTNRVHAIRYWGLAYLEAQYAKTSLPVSVIQEALEGSVTSRLAELDDSGKVSTYLNAKQTLAAVNDVKSRIDEVTIGGAQFNTSRSLAISYATKPSTPLALKDLPAFTSRN